MNHAPAALLVDAGMVVGPYIVEESIASSAGSALCLARDADGARLVLKLTSTSVVAPAMRPRVLREARSLAAVEHPGVVRVRGSGEHEGAIWIAMEWVAGIDLKRCLADQGPLESERALEHVIEAAEALAAAHDAGIVHRGLKPSKLLLTPEGRIVIVDFGVAKRRPDPSEDDSSTSTRELFGTAAYLSPEQIEHGLADERSDVWALGCILFELVYGAPPFGCGGPLTAAAILHDEPVFAPSVPGVVRAVISACLRKSSFARVASPREFAAMARDGLDEIRSRARDRPAPNHPAMRSSTRISIPPSSAPIAPAPAGETRTPTSQRRLVAADRSRRNASAAPSPPQPTGPLRASSSPASSIAPRAYGAASAPGANGPASHAAAASGPRTPATAAFHSAKRDATRAAPSDAGASPLWPSRPRAPSIAPPPPARPSSMFPSSAPVSAPNASSRAPQASAPKGDGRGRIKGAAVRAIVAWFIESHGATAAAKLVEGASPDLRAVLRPADPLFGIMASGWYDTHAIGEMIDVLERIADPPDRDRFVARMGEAVARDNVHGVYRALFRLVASPVRLESNAQRVWRMYFDEGTLTVDVRSPGAFEASVQGWTRHHPTVCRFLRAFLEHSLRGVGYKTLLLARARCTSEAGGPCIFHGRWSG